VESKPLCYNARNMRQPASRASLLTFFFVLLFYPAATFGKAQSSAAGEAPAAGASEHGQGGQGGQKEAKGDRGDRGVYLVFPFENSHSSPHLDWLGEGLEELTIQRLSAAGEEVYSHAGRITELERYGLPSSAKLSHATMLHIAEDLDADFVVFGSFISDGTSLTIEARVLRVTPTALLPAVRESGSLNSLMELHTRLAWHLLADSERSYPLTLAEFTKAQRPLRLDAFEHYSRGLLSNDDEARLRELREAARLEPDWPEPAFALGEVYFTRRDCNSALTWYARVPKTNDRHVQAVFATGVCRLLLNQPDRAEEVFVSLQKALHSNMVSGAELPEILNDLAVGRARQGKIPAALSDLRRAADMDPDEDDYPFNLGLLALRSGDFNAAAKNFREAVSRQPDKAENRSFLIWALEKAGQKTEADQEREAATETFGPNGLPNVTVSAKGEAIPRVERIKTQLDSATLRFELQSDSSALSASAAAGTAAVSGSGDTPATRVRRGRQELSAGRLDTAEREFRAALALDPANAAAHHGLGEINRSRGKLDEAVAELQSSLKTRDSAEVRTTLARIYLEQKRPDLARAELDRALKLAPNYLGAKQLLEYLQKSGAKNVKPARGAQ
jgi:tetratricopeptide (TPR) repeat protein